MSCVRRFIAVDGSFHWDGITVQGYESSEMQGTTVRWLVGPEEGAPSFAIRYFEVEPGGCTSLDIHEHDHGVVVLRGRGRVLVGDDTVDVSFGDVVYVSPREQHQFRCVGQEPFGFLCVIPAERSTHE